jgi:ankyrin repeat protein
MDVPQIDIASFEYRMRIVIEQNDFRTFIALLGATDEEKLQNAQRVIETDRDHTPFLYCASYLRHEMLEYLLNIPNIDVNQKDNMGHSALATILDWQMCENMENCTTCAKLLLSQNTFDITTVDKYNRSLLMLAVQDPKHLQITRMLLERQQIDVNLRDSLNDDTALMHCVRNRFKAGIICELLRDTRKMQINFKDEHFNIHPLLSVLIFGNGDDELLTARQFLNHADINFNSISELGTDVIVGLNNINVFAHALLLHGRI